MGEILDKVYETQLTSPDNWKYIIRVYEDETELFYQEGEDKPTHLGTLTAEYDLQVAKEIIRLRELKMEQERTRGY